MKYLIALLLCLLSEAASAQRKFEKEVRIRNRELSEQVPKSALDFVDALPCDRRIRWYREEGYTGHSFEAKTKVKRQRISIEFSADGTFEDIEVAISPEGVLKKEARSAMEAYLKTSNGGYRIEKIQLQFSGDPELASKSFTAGAPQAGTTVRYEWVVSSKVDGEFALFEYLFDDDGAFLQRTEIDVVPADNIEY